MKPLNTFVLCTALALPLTGCGSGDKAKVSEKELAAVRTAQSQVHVGQSKTEALAAFQHGNKTRLSSSSIDGAAIEEWKVEAFYDSSNRRDQSVTFLYFMNDKLVDTSDKRLNYRETPALVTEWKKHATK